jgi:ERCC4-type nuclease
VIYVDPRIGSGELARPLQMRGLPVEVTPLDFGDIAIVGNGPGGHTLLVGVERKRITDLVQSMTSGRLSGHQLPGLVEMYAHRWLLVEGAYREADNGLLEIPAGGGRWTTTRLSHSAVEAYLLTLTLRGGLHVHRTFDTRASVIWIGALHQWWTAKQWSEHRSHLATHQPADPGIWSRPTIVHKMAAQLPGIGDEKAAAVAKHFKTVTEMVEATEAAWRQIPGIGKTLAAGAVRSLRGTP